MEQAPIPSNEGSRLETLRAYEVLDSGPEQSYDRIVQIASQICDTPIALVSLVDESRQWFKASVGLDAKETARDISFCGHAVAAGATLTVEDATKDPRFADNPLVLDDPSIRFYAGVPLKGYNGESLGTLCAIDRAPRKLTDGQLIALKNLAREVEVLLELRRTNKLLESVQEQKNALARMTAHDLMNTLMVGLSSADRLTQQPDVGVEARNLLLALQSSLEETVGMSRDLQALVSHSVDVSAHVKPIEVEPFFQNLCEACRHRVTPNGHPLETRLAFDRDEFATDERLVRRMVHNLVENAGKYSPRGAAIELEAQLNTDGKLRIQVLDRGGGVPETERENIFDEYVRLDETRDDAPGTGLGLAFVRLATQTLGGRWGVDYREGGGSRFWIVLPDALGEPAQN